MKYLTEIYRLIALVLVAGVSFACAKVEEPDYREADYGYVQFKVYKAASYQTKAESTIQYLGDIAKISLDMKSSEGSEISQTLVLSASSASAAEYGLRSEKLMLLADTYSISTYSLYDKLDNLVATYSPDPEFKSFTVVPGGLCVHDLLADVVERGSVKFSLIKDFTETPQTKTSVVKEQYTFDEIGYVTIELKNTEIKFEMLPADFSIHFDDEKKPDQNKDKGWQTSSFECDTLVYVKAGTYEIKSYTVYNRDKDELEYNDEVNCSFTVSDNVTTEVQVPVKLHEDAYIRDYRVLKKIYDALDGKNWYYQGDEWPVGSSWDFDKDIDLWGAQPGVKLLDNGRVALISLSGFGISGDMPAEIGELTALEELYLGNHNETNFLDNDPTVEFGMSSSNRMARHSEYLRRSHVLTQFSEPIARGMKEKGVSIPEIALYETMTEKEIFDASGNMRIRPMQDVLPGVKTNGLKSIPKEIANLKNLRIFFLANSAVKELPEEFAQCEEITDLEIYNCPDMKNFPTVISKLPKLTSANLSANPQWEDVDAGLVALGTGPSAKSLQIIYMNECSLTVLPKELNNMKKLGMLSVSSNKIHTIESAYPDIAFVQLFLDNNKITEIPHTVVNGKRMFFRIEDVETFSCSYNKLTKFPDIFDAESIYGMSSVDFSYNQITEFENGDSEDYQGIYVATLSLANNPNLKKYPKCITTSKSKVDYINVRGCGIEEIPEGSFKGENTKYMVSLDLSYNKLKDFPREFTAASFPYFYGLDLSYNQLSEFPYEPFDCASLTMLAVRGQRNEKGERCLSEWPTGVYNHTGLRALYVGSNDLGKINDTISYLIYYLDISDNPNIVFDASDICYNWQAGTYFLLYDKTQKILNCDAMLQ